MSSDEDTTAGPTTTGRATDPATAPTTGPRRGSGGDPPARRRGDRDGGGERALDWGVRDCDVLLGPHSPLAIADILTRADGAFDLVATDAPTAAREPSSGGPRARRTRANLLSCHTAAELRARCRAAIVEIALVRRRGERGLWLAAGFLVQRDESGRSRRAPLLRWPATLVCKPGDAGHEVRLLEACPSVNPRLAASLARSHSLSLPALDPTAPLAEHFGRLAELVAPHADLELEFDIGLGNAALAPAGARAGGAADAPGALPDVSEHVDVPLAMALTGDVSLEQLDAILALMPDVPTSSDALPASVAALRHHSVKLAARGLDRVEFGALDALPARLGALTDAVGRALGSPTVARLAVERPIEVGQLAKLGNIIELVDKAPGPVESHRHPDLAYASSGALLRRAKHQAQLVEAEFASLQDRYALDKVPPKAQLLQLIDRLGGAPGGGVPDVIDADYFHARRRFMEFSLVKPAQIDGAHLRSLGQLARVLRFRELFVNNTEYRRALGGGYRGLRTDWAALETVVDYAAELAGVLGSEALAALAMADFGAFRTNLVNDLETLRAGSEALLGLLALFGVAWRRRPAHELVAHAGDTVPRLAEWRDEFGDMHAHRRQTPGDVLSRFSSDGSGGETERRLVAARARIDLLLSSGETSPETVAGTLEWLRTASRRATEERLTIGAIVDHLRIA